jgi:hypothetical protein
MAVVLASSFSLLVKDLEIRFRYSQGSGNTFSKVLFNEYSIGNTLSMSVSILKPFRNEPQLLGNNSASGKHLRNSNGLKKVLRHMTQSMASALQYVGLMKVVYEI